MNKEKLKQEIIDEIHRTAKWEGTDNWKSVRSLDIFTKENSSDLYEGLQSSRGLNVSTEISFEENIQRVISDIDKDLLPQDVDRQNEIEENIDFSKIKNVFELGFRTPRILNFYKNLGKDTFGIDVVRLNALIGQYLGYDCDRHDLTSDDPLNFKENSLIISYHCFEHLPDPQKTLNKVKNAMPSNSWFHIEVPTEDIHIPNVRYGHCFAFHSGMLKDMLIDCGFKILSYTNSHNQRALVTL